MKTIELTELEANTLKMILIYYEHYIKHFKFVAGSTAKQDYLNIIKSINDKIK